MILCVGNEMRGDDAAGLAVAEQLRARGVEALVEQPQNLIDVWEGAGEVVVVDTVHSGAPPGTLHRIDAGRAPIPADLQTASTHLLGLGEAIELARTLGRLPDSLLVVGIEGESFGRGDPLSPDVERAVARVVEELAAQTPRRAASSADGRSAP